jgi:plastocyanin
MRALVRGIALAVAVLAVAACGGQQVGNSSIFNSATSSGNALGGDTPTPAPTTPPAPVAATTSTSTTTTAPRATAAPTARPPAPTPVAAHFPVSINSDSSGHPQFEPSVANVYTGTVVVWTNHDSVARSVAADGGAFTSGPIAPGASWSWTATAAGTYNYHDGTRPYAVASITVMAH